MTDNMGQERKVAADDEWAKRIEGLLLGIFLANLACWVALMFILAAIKANQ